MPLTASATVTADSGAYAAGDVVGVAGAPLEFDFGIGRFSGFVVGAIIVDKAKQAVGAHLVLFDSADIDVSDDNAPFDPTDANLGDNAVGFVPVTSYSSFNDNALGQAASITIPFETDDNGKLYGVLVTQGTPTYVAADTIQVKLLALPEA